VSLAPLIVSVALAVRTGLPMRRVFALGVTAGFVYFIGTLYWIATVMATHGNLPAVVAYALMAGLAVHLSLFVALFAWTLGRSVRRFGVAGVWFAPWLWVAAEWLRAWLGWEFPWVLLGSSQASVLPVVQLASVTGVYGLSALIVFVSTAVAAVTLSRHRTHRFGAAGVAVLVLTVVLAGTWRVQTATLVSAGSPMRVGLLQGNVPQDAKSDAAYRAAIVDRYVGLTRQVIGSGAQLVIWPEASTPFLFESDPAAAAPIRRLAAEARVPFIIGTDQVEPAHDGQPMRYYNTAVLVGTDGVTRGSYSKVRLVPFGEYVPFKRVLFFVGPLVEAVSDFTAGRDFTVFDVEGSRLSVAICYEAVYASIAREFVAGGSQLLTTITNDAWFERSSAAEQHFQQAALRAVEQGRYLVRAANTGVSGAVDPYGRVLSRTRLFESTAVTVDVRLLSGRTIYHSIGDVVAWVSLVVAAAVVWMTRKRNTPS
jgi:apolipoprotein N-acyltransferase